MCHWNVLLTIVLAAWPQTINTQSSPNTSTFAPTNSTTITSFPASPSSASNSTPHVSASTPMHSSTSSTTLESTSSNPLTSPVPTSGLSTSTSIPTDSISTTQSNATSDSTKTSSTPTPSTALIPDMTSISPPDISSTSPSNVTSSTSPSVVPSTSPSVVPSTSPSVVPSTSPSDVTSESTKDDSTFPTTPIPSTSSTPAPLPFLSLDDGRKSLEWEATSNGTVIIEADEGYKIAVKVLKCDMDGENREFVIIGTGEAGKGVQFSYKVKRQPSFLFNTNVLYVEFNGTNASTFRANFSRVGEALTTTTTEITTSTQFLPTPSVNDSAVISVFVSGRRPIEYKDEKILNHFKDAVRKMATEYCFDQNFDLAEDITINNVKITRLMPCHSSWPNYETCAQITFGVPVYQKEDTTSPWQGYQLNSNHLTIMWNRHHKKYIDDDIATFDVPDASSWVEWQTIVFCGTTLVFLVCLVVLRHLCIKYSRESKSDDMDAIISISNEDNEISLQPHYIQQLPPLFENTYQDITPDLPPIINADVLHDLLENEDRDLPKINLTEENLGESGA